MRADASFAVPVKLWALLCVFAGVTIGGNVLLTCILTCGALLYLVLQRNFRLAASYGCFYLLLALLLYGIRFHGLHMPVFSEFYVLMFWNLSPIFLVSWDLITTPPGMLSAFLSRLRMPTPFILGLLVIEAFLIAAGYGILIYRLCRTSQCGANLRQTQTTGIADLIFIIPLIIFGGKQLKQPVDCFTHFSFVKHRDSPYLSIDFSRFFCHCSSS